MRHKITNLKTFKTINEDGEKYHIYLKDSMSKQQDLIVSYSEDEYKIIQSYYENHDIFLWDYKKQKKIYDEIDKHKAQLRIGFSIDGRKIDIEPISYLDEYILKVDMSSDFNNGFKFTLNEKDLKIISNLL